MPIFNIVAANSSVAGEVAEKYNLGEKVAKISEKFSPLLKKVSTGNPETDGYIALFVIVIGGFLLLMMLMRGRGSGNYDGRAGSAFEELDIRIRELRTALDNTSNERRGHFEYLKQDLALIHQKLDEQAEQIRILAQPVSELQRGMGGQFRGSRHA